MHHDVGLVLRQQRRQARAAARVVSPLMLALTTVAAIFSLRQPRLEQRHPAGAARQAVLGRQAVADDQHRPACAAARDAVAAQGIGAAARQATSTLQCASQRRRDAAQTSKNNTVIHV